MSQIKCKHAPEPGLFFKPGYVTVHVDEKWFYMDQTNARYYLANDEDEPVRKTRN